MKERDVLRAVLEFLAVKGIFAIRLNAGLTVLSYRGKQRVIRGQAPGTADVLALVTTEWNSGFLPLWIECKAPGGKQTELQKSFQRDVEERGMAYIIAESSADVEAFLREEGLA